MATSGPDYDFTKIEAAWQRFWCDNRIFQSAGPSTLPKFYVLDMFPYPSGAGLHLGHCENYTISDVMARYKRACGFNVLYPIGWDAFGLPTENYAVKTGRHPAEVTRENIATFRRQLAAIGVSYDFDREVDTTSPDYFRWTQWIWLQLFRRGLAYVENKPVWWCPALGTVLANEEVIEGRSEVGGHPVERRPLRQWVLRITAYADRLLEGLERLDWPDSTKRMQAAWIGRSEGGEVAFEIEGLPGERLRIFTTRVDTIFGATYMVVAPEHPLVARLTTAPRREAVDAYVRAAATKSDLERTELAKDKTGVFTGSHAIHPVTGRPVPIWIADYVLASYGTGAIMAVPAHDERDFEFATKYALPIVRVIAPADPEAPEPPLPWCESGRLVDSGACNGLTSAEAKVRLDARFAAEGRGGGTIQYKLRDWLFSRQRYWGEPFPIVWVGPEDYATATRLHGATLALPESPVTCEIDGATYCALPLPESALPLALPEVTSYQPTGTGESPLASMTDWVEIWHDPATGASVPASKPRPAEGWIRARRETNTMPQWAGSCWYYLRYLDPRCTDALASRDALAYWGGPDLYIGGAEHAVLHLLYARFWHKVLFDLGVVPFDEPFRRLFHQGIILGEDGEKMSKSRGNVANPDEILASHGADALRLYLMFLGPLEAMKPWNPQGIEGVFRFLRGVWREVVAADGSIAGRIVDGPEPDEETARLLHQTIRKVTADIEGLRYNTAVSQLMILRNQLQRSTTVARGTIRTFLQLLQPLAPHLASELWDRLGEREPIHTAPWPQADAAKLVVDTVKVVIQVNGRMRGEAVVSPTTSEEELVALARANDRVAPHLEGRTLRKVVHVPGRILNLVVG